MGDRWPLARRDRGRVARPVQAPGRGASTVPGAVRGPADRALRSPACRSSSNKRCPRRGAAGRSAPSCSSDSSAAHSPSWPRTRSALGARRTPGARLRPARAPSSSPASERSSRRGARHPPRRRGTYRQGPVARLGSVRPGCRDQHRSDQVSLVPEDHPQRDAGRRQIALRKDRQTAINVTRSGSHPNSHCLINGIIRQRSRIRCSEWPGPGTVRL